MSSAVSWLREEEPPHYNPITHSLVLLLSSISIKNTKAISTCLFASSSQSKINMQHSHYLQLDLSANLGHVSTASSNPKLTLSPFPWHTHWKHWNAQKMWACDRVWFWTLMTTRQRSLKAKFSSPEFLMSSYFQHNDHILLKGPCVKLPLTWPQLVWGWGFNQCSELPLPFLTSTTLVVNQWPVWDVRLSPHTARCWRNLL